MHTVYEQYIKCTGDQKGAQRYDDEHECDSAANYSHSHDDQQHLKGKASQVKHVSSVYPAHSLADLRVIH